MSEISHSDELVTKQDLSNFYQGILPYLGGMPEMLANKFNRSDIYSTDEKIVGQWIDGKPIYQKTIVQSLILPATSGEGAETQINLANLNIDAFVKLEGSILIDDDFVKDIQYITLTHINDKNKGTTINYQKSMKILSIWLSEKPLTSAAATITVRYTKTTDSAISIGSDTDYSTTEEKVVGTWVNGKPIYQKTIQTTMPTVTTDGVLAQNDVDIPSLNADYAQIVGGAIKDSNNVWGTALNCAWQDGTQDKVRFCRVGIGKNGITNNKEIYIQTNRLAYSERPCYITIQYTKTN